MLGSVSALELIALLLTCSLNVDLIDLASLLRPFVGLPMTPNRTRYVCTSTQASAGREMPAKEFIGASSALIPAMGLMRAQHQGPLRVVPTRLCDLPTTPRTPNQCCVIF